MPGRIRVGIGGWTYEPWRGVFYPEGLAHARELEFASRAVTTLEINGTYYSTFKPPSWRKWRDETPDDFVFAVKASRYCTNRKRLADAGHEIGCHTYYHRVVYEQTAEEFDAVLEASIAEIYAASMT